MCPALYYSDRLAELPLGVFGVAIATVILPSLSRQHSAEDAQTFSRTLDWALRMIFLIALPAALALILLAKPILLTLFQYGKTTLADVDMSSLSVQAYALGLLAFMLIKVLAPGFYARQDMKTPVRIGVIAMISNMGLNLLFVAPLYFWWGIGHVGLALATSVSAFINAGLLYRGLRRGQIYRPQAGWGRFSVQLLVANSLMGLVVWGMLQYLTGWAEWLWWQRAGGLAWVCGAGFVAYAAALLAAGIRPRHLRPARA